MVSTYERPYRPLEAPGAMVSGFPLRNMAEQLRCERTYVEHGVDALTLVRSQDLTVVLTVARAGHVLGNHRMPTAAMILALEGEVVVRSGTGEGEMRVDPGTGLSLGAGIDHEVHIVQDALLLTVLGSQPDLEDRTGRDRRWTLEAFEEATREVESLLEDVGLPNYRYEVEPAEHGWRVRVERMSGNCWKSSDLLISSETLRKTRDQPDVRNAVLIGWRKRLTS